MTDYEPLQIVHVELPEESTYIARWMRARGELRDEAYPIFFCFSREVNGFEAVELAKRGFDVITSGEHEGWAVKNSTVEAIRKNMPGWHKDLEKAVVAAHKAAVEAQSRAKDEAKAVNEINAELA